MQRIVGYVLPSSVISIGTKCNSPRCPVLFQPSQTRKVVVSLRLLSYYQQMYIDNRSEKQLRCGLLASLSEARTLVASPRPLSSYHQLSTLKHDEIRREIVFGYTVLSSSISVVPKLLVSTNNIKTQRCPARDCYRLDHLNQVQWQHFHGI